VTSQGAGLSPAFFISRLSPFSATSRRSAFELWLARRFGQIWALDYRGSSLTLAHQSNGMDSTSPKRHLCAKLEL
jgi:hypothetical protein